ncbi:MAG: hypothetical protein R3C68_19575 [Myxococcota bacterium]
MPSEFELLIRDDTGRRQVVIVELGTVSIGRAEQITFALNSATFHGITPVLKPPMEIIAGRISVLQWVLSMVNVFHDVPKCEGTASVLAISPLSCAARL